MKSILGPVRGYVEMLNEATIQSARKEAAGPKRFSPLRPSSAGKCTRELAYELMEYHGLASYPKEDRSAETQRIFNLGHHVEKHLIQEFERNLSETLELRYKQQVLTFFRVTAKTNPKLNYTVEGSLDTCFFSKDTRGVIDFKSKKDKFSQFHKTSWDETDDKLRKMQSVLTVAPSFYWVESLPQFLSELQDTFFEMNFVQLNGYACTDFLRERGIDHASIIQSNKNDSRLREVRFKPSMEVFEQIRTKFQLATDAVDSGDPTLAPRDHILGSLRCKFCSFKSQCWQVPDKTVDKAFYNTLPKKEWPRDTSYLGVPGTQLEDLFQERAARNAAEYERELIEQQILKLMMDRGISKLRLNNGEVYEAKQYTHEVKLKRGKS